MGVDESTYLPMLSVAQRRGDWREAIELLVPNPNPNPDPNPSPNPDPNPDPAPDPAPAPAPAPDPNPNPNQVHAKEIKCETGERSYNLTLTACANAREERACR